MKYFEIHKTIFIWPWLQVVVPISGIGCRFFILIFNQIIKQQLQQPTFVGYRTGEFLLKSLHIANCDTFNVQHSGAYILIYQSLIVFGFYYAIDEYVFRCHFQLFWFDSFINHVVWNVSNCQLNKPPFSSIYLALEIWDFGTLIDVKCQISNFIHQQLIIFANNVLELPTESGKWLYNEH